MRINVGERVLFCEALDLVSVFKRSIGGWAGGSRALCKKVVLLERPRRNLLDDTSICSFSYLIHVHHLRDNQKLKN